mmetsp:Transcript_22517/g.46409  ORF Transcript_22517/g.46409 Transcript_22517/m.46409 type:complete len:217 (-) Transcript_22517:330-980(-)
MMMMMMMMIGDVDLGSGRGGAIGSVNQRVNQTEDRTAGPSQSPRGDEGFDAMRRQSLQRVFAQDGNVVVVVVVVARFVSSLCRAPAGPKKHPIPPLLLHHDFGKAPPTDEGDDHPREGDGGIPSVRLVEHGRVAAAVEEQFVEDAEERFSEAMRRFADGVVVIVVVVVIAFVIAIVVVVVVVATEQGVVSQRMNGIDDHPRGGSSHVNGRVEQRSE